MDASRVKLNAAITKGRAIERELLAEKELRVKTQHDLAIACAEREAYKSENSALLERLRASTEGDIDVEEDDDLGDGDEGELASEARGVVKGKGDARASERASERARLESLAREARNEAMGAIAEASNARKLAESARVRSENERKESERARERAEAAELANENERATREMRIEALESEIERASAREVLAKARVNALERALEAKSIENEEKLARARRARDGGEGNERAEARRMENELALTREALKEAKEEIAKLRASDATESANAARARESLWKERAQRAMAAAAAAEEAREREMSDGGIRLEFGEEKSSNVSDVFAFERRAKEAERALAETRAELARANERARFGASASGGQDPSLESISRRLAESEALVLVKNAEIASLTRRFTDLAWRATMSKPAAVGESELAFDAPANVDAATSLLPARRSKYRDAVVKHRRFIIGGYLALLHLLAYDYLTATC